LLEFVLLRKVLWELSLMTLSPLLDGLNENDTEWGVVVVVLSLRSLEALKVDGVAVFEEFGPRAGEPEVRLVFHRHFGLDNAALRFVVPQVAEHAILSDEHEGDVVSLAQVGHLDGEGVGGVVEDDEAGLGDVAGVFGQVIGDGKVVVVARDVGIEFEEVLGDSGCFRLAD